MGILGIHMYIAYTSGYTGCTWVYRVYIGMQGIQGIHRNRGNTGCTSVYRVYMVFRAIQGHLRIYLFGVEKLRFPFSNAYDAKE